MRKMLVMLSLYLAVALPSSNIWAENGVESGVGFPAGYMDYSLDGYGYQRIPLFNRGDIEFRLQGSFATKGDGHKGHLYTGVASSYILGRYVIASYIDDMTPFISPGAGFHTIYSWASGESPLNGMSKWTFTTKAHLFYGMEYKLGGNSYLIFQGRVTYPSDILFDSWFLGLGSRL